MRIVVSLALVLAAVTTASASPERTLRDGANHRLGDDSFVAKFGRAPTAADSESLRMRTHLEYVHAYLSARPATRPELAATRTRLLADLARYRDAAITPHNAHLPWRSPVFIDDDGRICAVGYLIERSVGHALAERIAATHRYAYLEDIAADMPEVASWIASSGFTLEELASIQPGYEGAELPWVEQWEVWTTDRGRHSTIVRRGPYDAEESDRTVHGEFRGGQMEGKWTKTTKAGVLVGSGTFHNGAGTWTSIYPDGKRLAVGPYANSRPNGVWRLYHASGNLAAEGPMSGGQRDGVWTFFHDSKARTPISRGRFVRGSYAKGAYVGEWKHFAADGSLLATSTPSGKGTYRLVLAPADGVRHEVAMGESRLDTFALGSVRIYRTRYGQDDNTVTTYYDTQGNALARGDDGTWTASNCGWSKKIEQAARLAHLDTLNKFLGHATNGDVACAGESKALPAERGRVIDKVVAAAEATRAPTPKFVTALVADGRTGAPDDFAEILASSYSRDGINWPHIDVQFMDVFVTLPGFNHPMLCVTSECRYHD